MTKLCKCITVQDKIYNLKEHRCKTELRIIFPELLTLLLQFVKLFSFAFNKYNFQDEGLHTAYE